MKQLLLGLHNFEGANGTFPKGVNQPFVNGLTAYTDSDALASDQTEPFGPNWAIMILPYLEQASLYNASNVDGYPGWTGPYNDVLNPSQTAPNANLYNMDWANTTLRGTRLSVFVCPTDAYNGANKFFYTPDDTPTIPSTPRWTSGPTRR